MTTKYILQADSTRISIRIPQSEVSEDLKNVVVFDVPSRKIVSIGEALDDIQAEAPTEWWEKHKASLGFISPFAAETFSPEYATTILEFYAIKARTRNRASWLLPTPSSLRRFNYELSIAGYERIPLDTRQEFEYLLKKSSSARAHSLVINGQLATLQPEFTATKQREEHRVSIIELTLVFFGAVWMIIIFGLFTLVFGRLTLNGTVFQTLPTVLLAVLFLVCVFGLVGVSFYIGSILSGICSVWILRRLLPFETLRSFLMSRRSPLPVHIRNWLLKNMLGEVSSS
jgi:hypothetical protein